MQDVQSGAGKSPEKRDHPSGTPASDVEALPFGTAVLPLTLSELIGTGSSSSIAQLPEPQEDEPSPSLPDDSEGELITCSSYTFSVSSIHSLYYCVQFSFQVLIPMTRMLLVIFLTSNVPVWMTLFSNTFVR